MNKPRLKLMLDELSVETFNTVADRADREGTVFGKEDGATDEYSCPGDCFATYDTDCQTNNGTCTEPSCRNEISCRFPSRCIPLSCAC